MGFELLAGYEAPFNPNLNPAPALRDYPGVTDGLLAAYHFDLSPSPLVPVAGSHEGAGVWSGSPTQEPLGYRFDDNDLLNSQLVPGSDLVGLTLFCIARRTGYVPSGAVETGSTVNIGTAASAAYRMDLDANSVSFTVAVSSAPALYRDTSEWGFYAFSISTTGSRLYRPAVQTAPVTTTVTIAEVGAAALNNPFRIGTAGTNIRWAEVAIMAAGLFGRQLSDAEVLDQYEAYQAYAAEKGVTL